MATPRDTTRYPCPSCKRPVTMQERRGPGKVRGAPFPTCVECRDAHPGQRWCAACGRFEKPRTCPVTSKARTERTRRDGGFLNPEKQPCPNCGTLSTNLERKRGKRVQGNAPRLCVACQDRYPGQRWCDKCERLESQNSCPVYMRHRDDALREAGKYRSQIVRSCERCDRTGTAEELRGEPGVGIPRICHQCAADAPDQKWCSKHLRFEAPAAFIRSTDHRCGYKTRVCVVCGVARPKDEHMGADFAPKATPDPACVACREQNPGRRWCVTHRVFEPADLFPDNSPRCRRRGRVPDHIIRTLEQVHDTIPDQCMCCRAMDKLLVTDHDHDCCPGKGKRICGQCARGRICYGCNTIEGKIRTIYGPPYPRLIQEYLDRFEAHRAAR